jgi:1,2-diacylglycerol 3-beta-galactosyltransferase
MTDPVHVAVIYTDAGGGHRASAFALKACLEGSGRYRVSLINPYTSLIPHLDLFSRFGSRTGENIYNEVILRQGRTGLTCWLFYAALRLNYVFCEPPAIKILARHFEEIRPDVVLSVMPLGNRVMLEALKRYRATIDEGLLPEGAVMITDWAELAKGVWFPNRADYHAICGTQDAVRNAEKLPKLAGKVHAMGGLLIRPEFTDPAQHASKQALNLDPARPVVTVLYGAQGSMRMIELAQAMRDVPHSAQVVFLCGRNEALADELRSMDLPYPVQVLGFTDKVARYLSASDLFIGKPGPGSTSEAMALGLSMLLDKSLALPQEAAVLRHVIKTDAGQAFSTSADFSEHFRKAISAIETGQSRQPIAANTSPADILQIMDRIAASRVPVADTLRPSDDVPHTRHVSRA